MCHKIVTTTEGRVLGAHSWVDGYKPISRTAQLRRLSESEADAHMTWIARHVSQEAASEFLDKWAQGHLFWVH